MKRKCPYCQTELETVRKDDAEYLWCPNPYCSGEPLPKGSWKW